jgi:Cu/Zn superoxide dismutase
MRRHVGDLGNLTTSSPGMIVVNFVDGIIDLYNQTRSIVNRAIVVHLLSDDGGTGNGQSSVTGFVSTDNMFCNSLCVVSSTYSNAGGRLACGLIKETINTASFHVMNIIVVLSNVVFVLIFSVSK